MKPAQHRGKRQIALYVTPEECNSIENIARLMGKSTSAFVKQAVFLYLRDLLAQADEAAGSTE